MRPQGPYLGPRKGGEDMRSCRVAATPSFDYSETPDDTLHELLRLWAREYTDDHWLDAPAGDFELSRLKLDAIREEIARRETERHP